MAMDPRDFRDVELTRLIRETLGENADKPFVPCAYYDSDHDRIEVLVRDCSYTEIWFNGVFYVFESNYPPIVLVGFAVDIIRLYFYRAAAGEVDLYDLLDKVQIEFPWLKDQITLARELITHLESHLVNLPDR